MKIAEKPSEPVVGEFYKIIDTYETLAAHRPPRYGICTQGLHKPGGTILPRASFLIKSEEVEVMLLFQRFHLIS